MSLPLTAPHRPRLESLPSTQAPRALSCVFRARSVLELTASQPRGSELRTLGSRVPLARSSARKFTCALEFIEKAGSFIRLLQVVGGHVTPVAEDTRFPSHHPIY